MKDVAKVAGGVLAGVAVDEGARYILAAKPPKGHADIANEVSIRRTYAGQTVKLEPQFTGFVAGTSSVWWFKTGEDIEMVVTIATPPGKTSVEFSRMGAAELVLSFRGVTRTMPVTGESGEKVVLGYSAIVIE